MNDFIGSQKTPPYFPEGSHNRLKKFLFFAELEEYVALKRNFVTITSEQSEKTKKIFQNLKLPVIVSPGTQTQKVSDGGKYFGI